MGNTGVKSLPQGEPDNGYINQPTNDENDMEGIATFEHSSVTAVDKWFSNPKLSNYEDFEDYVKNNYSAESAIDYYTGNGYDYLNEELYETPWDDMTDSKKKKAADLFNALNQFELNKAILCSRGTSLSYFGNSHNAEGLKDFLNKSDGLLQFNGFQSTSTGSDPAFGGSLVIHYTIPPSKGAGAYVRPISNHPSEREFLLNTNGVFKFDTSSIKVIHGTVHINAAWVGQAADQVFTKDSGDAVYTPKSKKS